MTTLLGLRQRTEFAATAGQTISFSEESAMSNLARRQIECAAFCHAGQAVAAAELAVPFKAVESDRVVGIGWPEAQPSNERQRLDREKTAYLVWLSGLIAEQKFASGGPIDAKSIKKSCRRTSREAGQLADRCLALIANPQPWSAICDVARQLLERQAVTAAAVRSAVAAAE